MRTSLYAKVPAGGDALPLLFSLSWFRERPSLPAGTALFPVQI